MDIVMDEVNHICDLRNLKIITDEESTEMLNSLRAKLGLPPLSSYDYLPLFAAMSYLCR